MYLTDLRVSALALFCSVALVLGATHYTAGASESCGGCVEVESVSNASAVQATRAVSEEAAVAAPSGSMC
jgi:hypothetical protein